MRKLTIGFLGKKRIHYLFLSTILLLSVSSTALSQFVYFVPSHFQGLFSHQLSSARAQGMGYTTITTDGIATSMYNPATISPGKAKMDVSVNYAKGHPYYPKSYYPFVGASYRVLPKLVIGASAFSWVDPRSYWQASIGGQNFPTTKRTQHLYSLTAAYEVTNGLHAGISGNLIREKAVNGTTTIKENIFTAGFIYDKAVSFIKHDKIKNQQIRGALSLTNVLMKGRAEQTYQTAINYRDLPVIARVGAGYGFSIPLQAGFTKGKKFFEESPELLDLSLRLQYQNWLKVKDHIFTDNKYSTAIGVGAEAWFMKLLALRLGYYSETREQNTDPGDIAVTTPRKAGFTWGFGGNIPVKRLSGGKVPVDVELNFVTSRLMNEFNNQYENSIPRVFSDKKMLFSVGMNVRWSGQ